MRTCWVIDHPAHFQLFRPFFGEGDTLIVTRRQELDIMLEAIEGHAFIRVERVQGGLLEKVGVGRARVKAVVAFLRDHPVERIISKGAPLELRAAKRCKVAHRIYLSDTEVNTIAHRLAKGVATACWLPANWKDDIGFFASSDADRLYTGILPAAYLDAGAVNRAWESAKGQAHAELGLAAHELVIFHRELIGGGIHDDGELIDYAPVLKKMGVHFVHTKEAAAAADGSAWALPTRAALFDGVITGSTTLASEMALCGVPTLLISKAERGFLDAIRSAPHVFIWNDPDLFDGRFAKVVAAWKMAMHAARTEGRRPLELDCDLADFIRESSSE